MPTWVNPETLNEYGAGWVERDRLDNGRYNSWSTTIAHWTATNPVTTY